MEKLITTKSGREIKLSSSAAFLYLYKSQFHRDPLKDLMEMSKENGEGNFDVDTETLYNVTWALAKCANKEVSDPISFYTENSDFLPLDHVTEIIEIAMGSLISEVEIEKN